MPPPSEPGLSPLDLSHQGLNRDLIPVWIRECPQRLNDLIEDSAFGQTPPHVARRAFGWLELKEGTGFLDLGSGAGGVCLQAVQETGCRAYGVERNPSLVRAAKSVFGSQDLDASTLLQRDFLLDPWPDCETAFVTSARLSPSSVQQLTARIEESRLRRVVSLGRELPLPRPWRVHRRALFTFAWNPGESEQREPLVLYLRSCQNAPFRYKSSSC